MRLFHFVLTAAVFVVASSVTTADENPSESQAVATIELLGGKVTRDDTLQNSSRSCRRRHEPYGKLLPKSHETRFCFDRCCHKLIRVLRRFCRENCGSCEFPS